MYTLSDFKKGKVGAIVKPNTPIGDVEKLVSYCKVEYTEKAVGLVSLYQNKLEDCVLDFIVNDEDREITNLIIRKRTFFSEFLNLYPLQNCSKFIEQLPKSEEKTEEKKECEVKYNYFYVVYKLRTGGDGVIALQTTDVFFNNEDISKEDIMIINWKTLTKEEYDYIDKNWKSW